MLQSYQMSRSSSKKSKSEVQDNQATDTANGDGSIVIDITREGDILTKRPEVLKFMWILLAIAVSPKFLAEF